MGLRVAQFLQVTHEIDMAVFLLSGVDDVQIGLNSSLLSRHSRRGSQSKQ